MTHLLPCTKEITSEDIASIVMREVFCHVLDNIVSDRGPQFISEFRKHLFKCSRSHVTSPPATIPKHMEKQNVQIKQWNNIFSVF